ncbi:hypothetical protein CHUAL_000497 [Chamberlinius hualienensis]
MLNSTKMCLIHLLTILTAVLVVTTATAKHTFLDRLLSAAEHETHLNEELATLLDIQYDRQGACGSDVTSTCCTSCGFNDYCYNGGYCCELNKVRTKMLKSDENECPISWQSECKMTKLMPIESCTSSGGRKKHKKIESSDESNDSKSSEDRNLDKAGFRLMCVCVSALRCCSLGPNTTSYYGSI